VQSIHRLKKDADFKKVLAHKQSFRTPSFAFYYRPNFMTHIRVGVSVSKKLGGAVVRNRLRRQTKTMIQNQFDFTKAFDMIVVIKEQFLKQSYHDNLKEIQRFTLMLRR
jgi:ribonuclease P protein component